MLDNLGAETTPSTEVKPPVNQVDERRTAGSGRLAWIFGDRVVPTYRSPLSCPWPTGYRRRHARRPMPTGAASALPPGAELYRAVREARPEVRPRLRSTTFPAGSSPTRQSVRWPREPKPGRTWRCPSCRRRPQPQPRRIFRGLGVMLIPHELLRRSHDRIDIGIVRLPCHVPTGLITNQISANPGNRSVGRARRRIHERRQLVQRARPALRALGTALQKRIEHEDPRRGERNPAFAGHEFGGRPRTEPDGGSTVQSVSHIEIDPVRTVLFLHPTVDPRDGEGCRPSATMNATENNMNRVRLSSESLHTPK